MRQRLNFRLKEWAPRVNWSSTVAREVWEPRISQISQTWQEVEREAVKLGVKPSVLQHVSETSLTSFIAAAARAGCVAIPLAKVADADGYASASAQGPLTSYRVAYTTQQHVPEWVDAWQEQDNDRIGKLLGYPDCCRKFFQRVWVAEGKFDTTVDMEPGEASPYTNLLWRWSGVRLVSHLPCGYNCKESRLIGEQMLHVFEKVNMEQSSWAWDILRWPVRYTTLHGIAEITTPIHRMCVASDAYHPKQTVDFMGREYPVEGASGGFPHKRQTAKSPVRQKPKQQATEQAAPTFWNGFQTKEAMQKAHQMILDQVSGSAWGTVLDLGCGDGALLNKISANRRIGMESNVDVAKLAKQNGIDVILGDVTDHRFVASVISANNVDLVLAQRVRNPLETISKVPYVVQYSYDEPREAKLYDRR